MLTKKGILNASGIAQDGVGPRVGRNETVGLNVTGPVGTSVGLGVLGRGLSVGLPEIGLSVKGTVKDTPLGDCVAGTGTGTGNKLGDCVATTGTGNKLGDCVATTGTPLGDCVSTTVITGIALGPRVARSPVGLAVASITTTIGAEVGTMVGKKVGGTVGRLVTVTVTGAAVGGEKDPCCCTGAAVNAPPVINGGSAPTGGCVGTVGRTGIDGVGT
jgi:hypothetical protein